MWEKRSSQLEPGTFKFRYWQLGVYLLPVGFINSCRSEHKEETQFCGAEGVKAVILNPDMMGLSGVA